MATLLEVAEATLDMLLRCDPAVTKDPARMPSDEEWDATVALLRRTVAEAKDYPARVMRAFGSLELH